MIDVVAQYTIMVLGPSAVFMVGMKNKWRRWGFVVGLACQPFWFITLINNHQWPVVISALVYTFSWACGFYNVWIKKEDKK